MVRLCILQERKKSLTVPAVHRENTTMPGKLGKRRLIEERLAATSYLLHILYQLEVDKIQELDGVHKSHLHLVLSKVKPWMNPYGATLYSAGKKEEFHCSCGAPREYNDAR